jgi:hypothetical protein
MLRFVNSPFLLEVPFAFFDSSWSAARPEPDRSEERIGRRNTFRKKLQLLFDSIPLAIAMM